MRRAALASLAILAATASMPARAETVTYTAALNAASEVPPTGTNGSGRLVATYDTATRSLAWKADYAGLTGPASAAHFHAPAPIGKNAGVAVPITGSLTSPIEGKATLTEDQAKALMNGDMYFNVHTDAHKGGEIRGQLVQGS